jgi:hypothetical protein
MIPVVLFVIIAIVLPLSGAWWGAWLAGAFVGFFFFDKSVRNAVAYGFILGLTVCLIWSLILFADGGDIISQKVAQIFSLPNGLTLILLSSIINGLIAMLGSGLGSSLRQLVTRS